MPILQPLERTLIARLPDELKLKILDYVVVWNGKINYKRHDIIRRMGMAKAREIPELVPLIPEHYYKNNTFVIDPYYPKNIERSRGTYFIRFPAPNVNQWVKNLEIHLYQTPLGYYAATFQFLCLLAAGEIGFERLQRLKLLVDVDFDGEMKRANRPGRLNTADGAHHHVIRQFLYNVEEAGGLSFETECLEISVNDHECTNDCASTDAGTHEDNIHTIHTELSRLLTRRVSGAKKTVAPELNEIAYSARDSDDLCCFTGTIEYIYKIKNDTRSWRTGYKIWKSWDCLSNRSR